MSNKYAKKIFRYLLGDKNIADLWTNFFCLSCNLTTTEDVVFDTGSLTDAVLASNALPGLIPPTIINGDLLVDGGVTNTLPGDVMKKLYGGYVMAVNVSQKRPLQMHSDAEEFPAPLKIILNMLNPFVKKRAYPLMYEIIRRSFIIGNKRKLMDIKNTVDYFLEPDMSAIKKPSYKIMDEIINIGYRGAKKELHKFHFPK